MSVRPQALDKDKYYSDCEGDSELGFDVPEEDNDQNQVDVSHIIDEIISALAEDDNVINSGHEILVWLVNCNENNIQHMINTKIPAKGWTTSLLCKEKDRIISKFVQMILYRQPTITNAQDTATPVINSNMLQQHQQQPQDSLLSNHNVSQFVTSTT